MTDTQVNASLDDDDIEEEDGGGVSKKILILVGAAVLILGGGIGAYFSGALDGMMGKESASEESLDSADGDDHSKGDDAHAGTSDLGATFLEIPDMIVNLSSDDGQPRYLRLSVQLELKSEANKVAVEQVMPRVVDQFQTYLRELRVKDLRGSAGIYRLQMELLARVNAAAYPIEVQDVLFQEILIQ